MGEGRRERSSRRRRSIFRTSQKSCSDSEVARTRLKERRGKSRDQLPWPSLIDVLTVDELARYRRKRVKNRPEDTLGYPGGHYGDSFEDLVTEYRRSFRATSEDSLLRDIDTSGGFDPGGRVKTNGALMEVDNHDASSIPGQVPSRPPLIRRGTSLKRGGDFYGATEYSNFRVYEGVHRPELARRPTSLRMEGDMRTVTEQCEKFIEWINVTRPELARVPTNLKIEGSQETSTESHDQYVPFVGARRPELLRQGAHLRLEGETTYLPEYTDVFRQPVNRERRTPMLPENHLRPGGEFSETTESTQQFVDPRGTVLMQGHQPQDPNNQELSDEEDDEEKRRKKEEEMKYLVSKLEDLKNPPLETPEYKDAFKNFPRERPKLLKPEDEIGLADGSKMHPNPNSARFRTKIDQDPEYKSKYLDQDRPVYRRPPMFSHRPSVGSSNFNKRLVPDLRSGSTSEVRAQYVPYGHVPRVESLRRASALRTEGHMDLQPEYRDAYCRRGSQSREVRNQRKPENNWANSENREMFGFTNAEHDQDAFQVVHTKVQDGNVVGKPPVARRGSRGAVQANLLRHRSPSPTYRLHVQNVDDEPRGFARRRSSSVRQTGHSPSPDRINDNQRSYSPSFGKEKKEAFVVLDNDPRRRRLDRNANIETEVRGRKRTPPNWMPPWYDSSGSV